LIAPWELALLAPLLRFFLAFSLILIITGGTVLLLYWIGQGEEK
jgi:hypothetical protein